MLDVAVEMNMVLFQGSRFEVKRWLDRDGAKNCYIRVDVKGGRTSIGVSYAVVTCPTLETAQYAFSVVYKWYTLVTQDIDERGWRYVSLKWWGQEKERYFRPAEGGAAQEPGQPPPSGCTALAIPDSLASTVVPVAVPAPPPGQPGQQGQFSATGVWLPWAREGRITY